MGVLWHATVFGALLALLLLMMKLLSLLPLPPPESEKLLAGHPEEGTNEALRELFHL